MISNYFPRLWIVVFFARQQPERVSLLELAQLCSISRLAFEFSKLLLNRFVFLEGDVEGGTNRRPVVEEGAKGAEK